MMRVIPYNTPEERTDGRFGLRDVIDQVKCDICGTQVRSRGLAHHMRQNIMCLELQSKKTSQILPPPSTQPVTYQATAQPQASSSSAESTTLPMNNNTVSTDHPTATTVQDLTKTTDNSPDLPQNAIPYGAPQDGVSHGNAVAPYTIAEQWWDGGCSSSAGPGIPEPSPEFIVNQLVGFQHEMHSSLSHNVPVTNADHGFINTSQHMSLYDLQDIVMPMGFEAPLVREPMPSTINQPMPAIDQVLTPALPSCPPAPHPQVLELDHHGEFHPDSHQVGDNMNGVPADGHPPHPIHDTVPSQDTMLYFFGPGEYDLNHGAFSSAESVEPPPSTTPSYRVPETLPTPGEVASSIVTAVPEGNGGANVPLCQHHASTTNAPYTTPPCTFPQTIPTVGDVASSMVTPFHGGNGSADVSQHPMATTNSPTTTTPFNLQESIPTHGEFASSIVTVARGGDGGASLAEAQQPAATTNAPDAQSMQLTTAAGAGDGVEHVQPPPPNFGNRLTIEFSDPAMWLRRHRMPKPNAPAIMLLIQREICPMCKRDTPLRGERDLKSHIRSELPYRTTDGQVLLLQGQDTDLPLAFTVDGRGYRDGILICPFCHQRVQVVCGPHDRNTSHSRCTSCPSFMSSALGHLRSHLNELKDPRVYVPGHHDSCRKEQSEQGCTCIPHFWSIDQ